MFAGIGGHTLGLQGILEPAAFIEIDPFCQRVLKSHWPDVPILNDVVNVTKKDVDGLGHIDAIVASAPCQGLSASGLKLGLQDHRSSLIKHVFRLAEELRPQAVFLENVFQLISVAMPYMQHEFKRLGYTFRWCVMGACDIGGPINRKRFWGLALRGGRCLSVPRTNRFKNPWPQMFPVERRLQAHKPKTLALRRQALGNAVCPPVVSFAFQWLNDPSTLVLRQSKTDFHGLMRQDGSLETTEAPPSTKRDWSFIMVPPTSMPEGCRVRDPSKLILKPKRMEMFAAPMNTSSNIAYALTRRTQTMLASQTYYHEDNTLPKSHKHVTAEFTEWLMGFPIGHTDTAVVGLVSVQV